MKYNKGAIMRSIEQPFVRDDHPEFETGDTVRVDYKVVENVAALERLDFADDELQAIDDFATESGVNIWARSHQSG